MPLEGGRESLGRILPSKSVKRKRSQVVIVPGGTLVREQSWNGGIGINLTMPQVYVGNHLTRSWTKDDKLRSNKDEEVVNETGTPPPEQHYYFRIEEADTDCCCSCLWFKRPSTTNNNSFRHNNNNIPSLDSDKHLAILLSHKNVSQEDLQEWRESFEALLANPAGQFMFQSFLASEVADENILFWLAVESLKKEKRTKQLQRRIQSVYDDFISVYSPHEVNIDYKMREEIVENLNKEPDPLIFRSAQMQIYRLMHRDSYPRFITTVLSGNLEKELAKRTKKSGNKKKTGGKNKHSVKLEDKDTLDGDNKSPEQEHHKLEAIAENEVEIKLGEDACAEQSVIVCENASLSRNNKQLSNDNEKLSQQDTNIASSQ